MRLKLRALTDGSCDDVCVNIDPSATVGDLALALFGDAPPTTDGVSHPLGVRVAADTPAARTLTPDITIANSGIRSGTAIGPADARLIAKQPAAVATLVVHDGPDAPAEFELHAGDNTIGRGPHCAVRLSDPLVSKQHATVVVDRIAEIVDAGSANGVQMRGRSVDRAVLHTDDRVVLGATVISVAVHDHEASRPDDASNHITFNRSPIVAPHYPGIRLVAPVPPQPPGTYRFPMIALIGPVLMAAMIYAVTRNALSIMFVALSPIMMIGGWAETRMANRKQLETETARFRAGLRDLAVQLEYALELEQAERRREHPSVVDVIDAASTRSPLVWTRRPEHDRFAEVRLGLGTQPSRNTVEMPSGNRTLPALWRELTDTIERYADVTGVPVVADVRASGNLGIAGAEAVAGPVVRGLVLQFAGLHSPAELHIAAIAPGEQWEWMKWLPHTSPERLAGDAVEASAVVSSIEQLIEQRTIGRRSDDDPAPLPLTVLCVHDDAPVTRARLVPIAELGPAVGVHVVWASSAVERLPAACRTFVSVDANAGTARAGFVRDGVEVTDLAVEPAGVEVATRTARWLSPLVDAGASIDASTDLPRSVNLVDLVGDDVAVAPEAICERWGQTNPSGAHLAGPGGLRSLVGVTADGPLHLDLRTDGPHALVGGTTGSGKSEFLQSWISSLAIDHSPQRLTFLLVDYKGGAAFADCVELPHCVGLVTDLRPHLVRRALASLEAELKHREQLLHDKRAKDLVELERRDDPECPPSLVIVVDEFAALVAEVPEFVDGVVNIAQRGRSLGLHLVLATQRPAGAINDNVRANMNLRIALRMADAADSSDVVGSTDAAEFDPSVPGRAVAKLGAGRSVTFQAAYSGGHGGGVRTAAEIEVASLRAGLGVGRSRGVAGAMSENARRSGPNDIARFVRNAQRAWQLLGGAAPRRPWLPELADAYRLEALPMARTDDELVIGVADDAVHQVQPTVAFYPDRDGNLAVYGTGGSGKSCALRSLAISAGIGTVRGGACWIYGLDFGARGLDPLMRLPHVGAVIPGDDAERVQRLLRWVGRMLDERAPLFAAAQASTICEYRERTGDSTLPRVMVLVDGIGAMRAEYEGGMATRWWDLLCRIATEGRPLGVHVVMAADRPSAVSSGLAASVQRHLVLRLANDVDYAVANVPADAFADGAPPGRGFLDGREVQVAVFGGRPDLATQAVAIERCAAALEQSGCAPAPPIDSLPTSVSLSALDRCHAAIPVIGVADDTLEAVGFEPTGTFVVAGPPASGRSTTVATMLRSIATTAPETEFVLFGQQRSPLASAITWAAVAHGTANIEALAHKLAERITDIGDRSLVVVIEAIGELLNTDADPVLQMLLRVCRDADAFVIAEGETSTLTGSWPLLQAVKSQRCGIALQPDQLDGDTLFKTAFPRVSAGEFPAGRGFMVHGGRAKKVQVALPE